MTRKVPPSVVITLSSVKFKEGFWFIGLVGGWFFWLGIRMVVNEVCLGFWSRETGALFVYLRMYEE